MELTKTKFKQTEVGLIPEDWDVKRLGEVGSCIIGLTYRPMDVVSNGTLVLRSSNVQDNKLAFHDNVYVDSTIPDNLRVKEGDILVCVRNGSRNLIGKCAILDKRVEGETFGAFMSVFRTDKSNYVFQIFQSNNIKRQIEENLGATINQITNKALNSFLAPFPPTLTEQKAIATALSDVDELIATLEKLIEKKKAIKQGAMQALLTPPHKGGKRLEGFSGDWVEMKLGDLCKITTGKLDANAMVSNGEFRFYTCARDFYFIDNYAFDTEALLVSGNGANVGYIHYYRGKFNAYQRTYVLDKFTENIQFIKLLLEVYLAIRIKSEKFEGNTPYIVMETLTGMLFYAPSSSLEQSAIATILIEMETELEGFERQKAKYQKLKEGMMQELLTGRTRLV